MSVSYDIFTNEFLSKISEYDFIHLDESDRTTIVDGFMKRAIVALNEVCEYNLLAAMNDVDRVFEIDIQDDALVELSDIISEGMVVQWLKPYVYKQELLENSMNTKDFTTYSPAELLMRVGNAYAKAQKDYKDMLNEYSYVHGDLTDLHL